MGQCGGKDSKTSPKYHYYQRGSSMPNLNTVRNYDQTKYETQSRKSNNVPKTTSPISYSYI